MDEKRVKEKKIIAFVIPSVLYNFSSLPSNESKKKKKKKKNAEKTRGRNSDRNGL